MDRVPSSFRDPSGFIFMHNSKIYRQINHSYKNNYEQLMESGLYEKLVSIGALIPHKEVSLSGCESNYKIIEPQQIPFISYSYEWCFEQLKDAALLVLQIQKIALDFDMSLKDASSFNVQFLKGKPIFIDSLSFEKYKAEKPWIAYKQFCEFFLAPLVLITHTDYRSEKLLQTNINGIPLDLAVKLLPLNARFNPYIFLHIFLHAKKQSEYSNNHSNFKKEPHFSKRALIELINNLKDCIKDLQWHPKNSVWENYYNDGDCESYESSSLENKKELVSKYLTETKAEFLWDLGANTGLFSKIAAKKGISVISMDYDAAAIEKSYKEIKDCNEGNILPLVIDLINPSPSIGWKNNERDSIFNRKHPDTVLALALIHHLAIGNNLPFSEIASFFSETSNNLIIEFVPKDDKQVQLILRGREDIFEWYNKDNFEKEFSKLFSIKEKETISDSKRIIYLMEKK